MAFRAETVFVASRRRSLNKYSCGSLIAVVEEECASAPDGTSKVFSRFLRTLRELNTRSYLGVEVVKRSLDIWERLMKTGC